MPLYHNMIPFSKAKTVQTSLSRLVCVSPSTDENNRQYNSTAVREREEEESVFGGSIDVFFLK